MDKILYVIATLLVLTALSLLSIPDNNNTSTIIGSILLGIGTLLFTILLLLNCITKKEENIPVATPTDLTRETEPVIVVIGIPVS